jgi:UDP-3-O-[3-hydroxymyristoyl] glucosamine N-acyltransferase
LPGNCDCRDFCVKMRLRELAEKVRGTIIGDPEIEISGVAGVADARRGQITFVSSPKFAKYIEGSEASCVIVKDPIQEAAMAQLQVANPYFAFAKTIEIFYPKPSVAEGISKLAFVSDKATVGNGAAVFSFAYISDGVVIGERTVISAGVFVGDNSSIGNDCILHPNVTIREGVKIGNGVTIHSGTVIGSDGFGYVLEQGTHYKIPQVGGVIIEDDVEIGSNVSIDRATLGNTIIGRGTKIDNLVQIGHNVVVGENSLIVGQAGIGGSSEIGDYVVLGGQVGVADHAAIESGAMFGAQSGLSGRYTKGVYSGSPAISHKLWLRAQSLFAKLPEINRKIREIEVKINSLDKGNKNADHK